MRARKRLPLLLLSAALLLSAGCASGRSYAPGQVQILETDGLGKKTTYRLQEMVPTEVSRTATLTVNESWQLIRSVRTGSAECRLERICVTKGQEVQAGDPVAILRGTGSTADTELKKLELSAFASGQAEMLAWYSSQIAAAEALPEETEAQQRRRSLQLEYARLEYRKYQLQSDYTLKTMRDQVAELEAAAGEIVLTAPVSGSIHNLSSRYAEGDLLPPGTELCTVYGSEGLRFYGSSGSGTFVYGREVEISVQKGGRRISFPGRVVSSPEVLNELYPTNVILLEVDATEQDLPSNAGEASVTYTVLSDVFAVPKTSISTRDGISCVEVLIGDTVCTRNVVRGPAAGSLVSILHGLSQGDQVVVSSYNS